MVWVAVAGYSVKLLYLLVLSYGLFRNPRGLKYLLMKCFRWRLLRKWRHSANEAGSDIVRNSYELRRKPLGFWLKTFGATFFFVDGAVLGGECVAGGVLGGAV